MVSKEHAELASRMAERMVESMDMDTLVTYAIDCLLKSYQEEYTMDQLVGEVKDYYPDLLEE